MTAKEPAPTAQGVPFDPDDPEAAVARLGHLSRMIGATLRDTANVTTFDAGYQANVVPSLARATVDSRMPPRSTRSSSAPAFPIDSCAHAGCGGPP